MIFDEVTACAGQHARPGRCPSCGRMLVAGPERRLYCSPRCRKHVSALPEDERQARRDAAAAGECAGCGGPVEPVVWWECRRGRRDGLQRMGRVAHGAIRFRGDALRWLAGELRLEPGDARLPAYALKLARADRLHALVARSGEVVALARTRRVA